MVKDGHFSFQTQLPRLKSNSLQEKKLFVFIIIFSAFFLNLAFFCLDWSNFSSAWYDNHFLFFCSFFSFSRSHGLFIPSNNACHRSPFGLKHHLLWENCFEKGWLLVQGCSYQFCPKKGLWLKKCSQKMGNFWSTCLKTFKVIPGYHDLGILFCSLKKFEAIASLDAYQITNYQFLSKLIIFFLIFEEFEK